MDRLPALGRIAAARDREEAFNDPRYLYLLQAIAGQEDDCRRWWLEEMGPRIAASPDCLALSVNIAADAAHARLSDMVGTQLARQSRAVHAYPVTTRVEKNEADRLSGNPWPECKLVRAFFGHADMPSPAFRRSWDNHVGLVLKIHGFARHVRYFIEGAVIPGASPHPRARACFYAGAHPEAPVLILRPGQQGAALPSTGTPVSGGCPNSAIKPDGTG